MVEVQSFQQMVLEPSIGKKKKKESKHTTYTFHKN